PSGNAGFTRRSVTDQGFVRCDKTPGSRRTAGENPRILSHDRVYTLGNCLETIDHVDHHRSGETAMYSKRFSLAGHIALVIFFFVPVAATSAWAQTYKVLHNFGGTGDGYDP